MFTIVLHCVDACLKCHFFPQADCGSLNSEAPCTTKCAASDDSYSDYGQYAISQSAHGHILVSAATALSTMDFSVLPVDHGVVDSPPDGGKLARRLKSPSPVKSQFWSEIDIAPQRKLYDERTAVLHTSEVSSS